MRNDYYEIAPNLDVIDAIEYLHLSFHLGNALKYIVRAGRKSDDFDGDLDKAIWYLERAKLNRRKEVRASGGTERNAR